MSTEPISLQDSGYFLISTPDSESEFISIIRTRKGMCNGVFDFTKTQAMELVLNIGILLKSQGVNLDEH